MAFYHFLNRHSDPPLCLRAIPKWSQALHIRMIQQVALSFVLAYPLLIQPKYPHLFHSFILSYIFHKHHKQFQKMDNFWAFQLSRWTSISNHQVLHHQTTHYSCNYNCSYNMYLLLEHQKLSFIKFSKFKLVMGWFMLVFQLLPNQRLSKLFMAQQYVLRSQMKLPEVIHVFQS